MGAQQLILVSRSGRTPAGDEKLQGMFDALSGSTGITVHAWSCDVADAGKTRDMLKMLGLEWMMLDLSGSFWRNYGKLWEIMGN